MWFDRTHRIRCYDADAPRLLRTLRAVGSDMLGRWRERRSYLYVVLELIGNDNRGWSCVKETIATTTLSDYSRSGLCHKGLRFKFDLAVFLASFLHGSSAVDVSTSASSTSWVPCNGVPLSPRPTLSSIGSFLTPSSFATERDSDRALARAPLPLGGSWSLKDPPVELLMLLVISGRFHSGERKYSGDPGGGT